MLFLSGNFDRKVSKRKLLESDLDSEDSDDSWKQKSKDAVDSSSEEEKDPSKSPRKHPKSPGSKDLFDESGAEEMTARAEIKDDFASMAALEPEGEALD